MVRSSTYQSDETRETREEAATVRLERKLRGQPERLERKSWRGEAITMENATLFYYSSHDLKTTFREMWVLIVFIPHL